MNPLRQRAVTRTRAQKPNTRHARELLAAILIGVIGLAARAHHVTNAATGYPGVKALVCIIVEAARYQT